MLVVATTPGGTVALNSVKVSKINVITQGNSLWTPEDSTHIMPKGGMKVNATWLDLGTITENNYTNGDKAKVDHLLLTGDGTKFLGDNGDYTTVDTSDKQDVLVSGTNIKTINSETLLGSGDVAVQPTLVSGTNIKTINSNSLLGSGNITIPTTRAIAFYVDGTLTVDTKLCSVIIPFAMTITEIRIAVDTAPTGASLIIDVNKNGDTLYTTQANRPTITASNTSATATDPDTTSIAVGDIISIDVDQIGSTVAGDNLKVIIICEV